MQSELFGVSHIHSIADYKLNIPVPEPRLLNHEVNSRFTHRTLIFILFSYWFISGVNQLLCRVVIVSVLIPILAEMIYFVLSGT